MLSFSPVRAAVVLIGIFMGFCLLTGRVGYLQTYGRQQTIEQAERQQHHNQTLPSRRGSIYDRNGMLMAGTVQTRTLFVDPKFMQDAFQADGRSLVEMDNSIEKIAALIDRDPFEIAQLLGDRYQSRFVKLAENLDESTCDQIRSMNLPGIGFVPTNVRFYPMGSIGSHVLGGTRKDGPGLEGIELQFQKLLAGRDGFKRTLKDARRRGIAVAAEDYVPPQHGQHLILTLDANIQMITEQELAAQCSQYHAKRGEAIVMNPSTGEVLAMANWPSFNPQNLDDSTPDIRRNRCLTDPYEPGSTFKTFLVGPALAKRITRVNEIWNIPGRSYKSSLRRKLVTDVHHYGPLATWDVLVKSSNIGMTMLAERMGKEQMYESITGFGFGKPTGIELPGEDPGRVNPLSKWSTTGMVSVAQGYEVMVTPIQLARAFSVYANGGRLVRPRIVAGVLNHDGSVDALHEPEKLDMMPQVVDPLTAAEMKRVLADVVVRGTATKAYSKVWNIFGKTGTAHVSTGGAYNDSQYTSSFICGAPAENPKVVVVMIIHEPDSEWARSQNMSYYGGAVAAPGAGRVVERTLAYLQAPASPLLPVPPPQIADVLVRFDAKIYQRKREQAVH